MNDGVRSVSHELRVPRDGAGNRTRTDASPASAQRHLPGMRGPPRHFHPGHSSPAPPFTRGTPAPRRYLPDMREKSQFMVNTFRATAMIAKILWKYTPKYYEKT